MTRAFGGHLDCPHCGASMTAETELEREIRNEPTVDSCRVGIVRFDLDILLHRYMFHTDKRGSRDIQAMMFIEVKTNGAVLTLAQRDTLSILSQCLRNRRRNINSDKKGLHLENHIPLAMAYSHVLRRKIALRLFGGHLLQLSGKGLKSSSIIMWDGKRIDVETFWKLIRFELDPDSLRKLDLRRRYSDFSQKELPLEFVEAG